MACLLDSRFQEIFLLAESNKIKESLETNFDNDKHEFVVLATTNVLKEEVDKIVVAERINVMVLRTRCATWAKTIFLGTRTGGILKVALCLVLVIPFEN